MLWYLCVVSRAALVDWFIIADDPVKFFGADSFKQAETQTPCMI